MKMNHHKLIEHLERTNKVLKYALRSVWKMRRLSQEYSNLLEENMTDEEYENVIEAYEEIAKPYAFTPRSLSDKEIAYGAKVILDTLDEELGSNDIANLLELDVMTVEKALTRYYSK